jgi:hypothetical protein
VTRPITVRMAAVASAAAPPRQSRRRLAPALSALYGLLGLTLGAYLLTLILSPGARESLLLNGWGSSGLEIVLSGLALLCAVRRSLPKGSRSSLPSTPSRVWAATSRRATTSPGRHLLTTSGSRRTSSRECTALVSAAVGAGGSPVKRCSEPPVERWVNRPHVTYNCHAGLAADTRGEASGTSQRLVGTTWGSTN